MLEEEAQRAHRGHVLRVTQGRPMVTFKIARTADGYAGGPGGTPIKVSSAQAMAWVHLQRAHHDAIMLGIGSVLADDPQLTVRLPGLEARSPVRVILDSQLKLPPSSTLVRTAREVPVWVIAAEGAPVAPELALAEAGVEVMRVSAGADGRLDLAQALALLGTRGITRVFSEEGAPASASSWRWPASPTRSSSRPRRVRWAGGRRRGAAGLRARWAAPISTALRRRS